MKNNILSQFSKFVEYLDSLTPEDLKKLEEGDCYIDFSLRFKAQAQKLSDKHNEADMDVREIIERLNCCQSRQEGEAFLNSLDLKNDSLGAIIRQMDLPYSKKDSKSKMFEKIIEGTIGFRLRSAAIQNGL